jgi:hypothetical protein
LVGNNGMSNNYSRETMPGSRLLFPPNRTQPLPNPLQIRLAAPPRSRAPDPVSGKGQGSTKPPPPTDSYDRRFVAAFLTELEVRGSPCYPHSALSMADNRFTLLGPLAPLPVSHFPESAGVPGSRQLYGH